MKAYLASLYPSITKTVFSRKTVADTYGEVLFESIEKISRQIKMQESDVLYDLGSGLGKVILQLSMQQKIKKIAGIELNSHLHHYASLALEQHLAIQKTQKTTAISFLCADFLTMPFQDATIVFIFSPCFTQAMLGSLGNIINQIQGIHTVASLKPISTLHLPFKKMFRVECSWDSALCYLYQKS